jgi:hypothetical protein
MTIRNWYPVKSNYRGKCALRLPALGHFFAVCNNNSI